jgi:predicted Fe-Mo cluster-binding NifX family protein
MLLSKKPEPMMKVAIPEHQGRVAPVFDTCCRMLVFRQNPAGSDLVAQEDWSMVSRQARAVRLKELGVDVLLCGAISCSIEDQVHLNGIELVAWLAGDVPKVLSAFREGTIMESEFAMPGTLMCRQRRRTRRGLRAQTQENGSSRLQTKEK